MSPSEVALSYSDALASLDAHLHEIGDLIEHEPGLTEIMVNPDGGIWLEKDGRMSRSSLSYSYDKRVSIIRLLAGIQNYQIGMDTPSLATMLPLYGGARVQAHIPPATIGPALTIRIPSRIVFSLDELQSRGALTLEATQFLKQAVSEHKTMVIAGGTGSGKTTVMKAILNEISDAERLVIVEDTPEIVCKVPNKYELRTTATFDMKKAIQEALRMRPDRIIVGEIRSGFVANEFVVAAANTGHSGSMATIHASTSALVTNRFQNLILEVTNRPDEEMISRALDIVVFAARVYDPKLGKEVRKVTSILSNNKEVLT